MRFLFKVKQMKYNEWQEHYYKTGKALSDLYCCNCEALIFEKGEELNCSVFTRDEKCCSDCDHVLHRRSPGGQSDTWSMKTKCNGFLMP